MGGGWGLAVALMCCGWLRACGRPGCGLWLCFPPWLRASGSGFGLFGGSDLKTYLLMR